jgi:hypothetical protein
MSFDAARFTQTHPLDGPPYRAGLFLLSQVTRERLLQLESDPNAFDENAHGLVYQAAGLIRGVLSGILPGGVRVGDIPEPLRRKLILRVADLLDFVRTPADTNPSPEREMFHVTNAV